MEKSSVANWESNRANPSVTYMPAIIRFLGYNPAPPPKEWSDRLVQGRQALGFSQKEAAQQVRIDQSTLCALGAVRAGAGRCAGGAGETVPQPSGHAGRPRSVARRRLITRDRTWPLVPSTLRLPYRDTTALFSFEWVSRSDSIPPAARMWLPAVQ